MRSVRAVAVLMLVMVALALVPTAAFAQPNVGFGQLYYDGEVVRTVVPPAAMPKPGVDPLYVIQGGAEGQLPVAGVGPGDRDYHGGKWAFYAVTWNVAPYLLTSGDAVITAAAAGDVTVTRVVARDFKCPIQP